MNETRRVQTHNFGSFVGFVSEYSLSGETVVTKISH